VIDFQDPITRQEIEQAAVRIGPWIRLTPVISLGESGQAHRAEFSFKLDSLQATGSFKARGAFSLLTSGVLPTEGVVAASGGNFGLAIAYAAARLGVAATIFVPASSPAAKRRRLEAEGALVKVVSGAYADALSASQEWAMDHQAFFAHAYDQREVVAGQGTCALELSRQVPEVETILVAVGGGGLIAGIASWFMGDVRVVGVETEGTPTLHRALQAGRPVDVEVSGIAVSSLGARRLGGIAFASVRQYVTDSLLVTDRQVVSAQQWMWDNLRLAVEPAAAAPVAAVLEGVYQPGAGEKVAVLICGANLDLEGFPGELPG
jgi:threonine dehydratase